MTRTSAELESLVRAVLSDIAPEMDIDALRAEEDMRDALDIDSVDFLNFVAALHEQTGIDIPERDYPMVSTVGGCVEYLSDAIGGFRP
jgi:acyl carrier protein